MAEGFGWNQNGALVFRTHCPFAVDQQIHDPRSYLVLLCFLFLQNFFQSHGGWFLKICSMKCVI